MAKKVQKKKLKRSTVSLQAKISGKISIRALRKIYKIIVSRNQYKRYRCRVCLQFH